MNSTILQLGKIRNQSGVAATEFAILLPLLLILTFSVIDFGRFLFQYNTLSKNTRDAARFMASVVRPPDPAYLTDINYQAAMTSATNLALCGTITTCGTIPIVNGLLASNIHIEYPATLPTDPPGVNYVRIMVRGYSTNFVTQVLGISQNLGDISVTMRQVQQP